MQAEQDMTPFIRELLISDYERVGTVMDAADEFLQANQTRWLKKERQKLLDLCVVAISSFEDELFTWDRLRTIAHERLANLERGGLSPWFIDVDACIDNVLTLRHENGTKMQFSIDQLLLTGLIQSKGFKS